MGPSFASSLCDVLAVPCTKTSEVNVSQMTRRRRRSVAGAGVVGLFAIIAALMTAVAPSANALSSTGDLAGIASGAPEVYRDTTDSTAGDLTIQSMTDESDGADLDTVVPTKVFGGEQLILEVSDGNFNNCTTSAARIGFNHVPTVTFLGATNVTVQNV